MSEFFAWDAAKYALSIPKIDDEHRQIVDAMNVLHGLNESKASRMRLADALSRLKKVTVAHFKDEEAYMEKIRFPGLRTHHLVHNQLISRLEEFEKGFQVTGQFNQDFFMFLRMWLKSHICGIDTKYAQHARAA